MNRSFGHRLTVVGLHVFVIAGALITVLPIVWMVFSSFKTTTEIFTYPPWKLPNQVSMANYRSLFGEWGFPYWYVNSLGYAGIGTVLVLFFTSLAGFAFAKYSFRGKNVLFVILLGSTMIPFQLLLIPLFILMSRLGWVNSPYSMIIPWMAPAFGIFLMRQYILAIPTELLESARIDGATELRIYWQIILPLVRPGLLALAILTFLGSWNSYIWPLMALRGSENVTLPVGLASMSAQATAKETPYGAMMAAASLVSVPVIVLFVLVQKHFVAGLTSGSVKA